MILSTHATIKINGKNIRHFISLGYKVSQGEILKIPISDMTSGSGVEIDVLCDYCFKPYKIRYKKYIKETTSHITKKIACINCKADKAKESLYILHGVTNVMGLKSVKDKLKQTVLLKYGVDIATKHPEIKNKVAIAQKNMTPEQKNEKRRKTEATCLAKYGVRSPLQLDKTRKGLFRVRASASKQQQVIYRMLKDVYKDCVVENFYISKLSLDILLTFNDVKINIEYDSSYWHNPTRDRRRDEFLKSKGYKILRVKSGKKVPDLKELIEKIDLLTYSDLRYSEIILSDWNDEQYRKGGRHE